MTPDDGRKRIGFFTRILDPDEPRDRYRAALDQIMLAEALGMSSAWVAQHHFDGDEGGLPSPFVFLAEAAARTATIRLGTGIVTLALEQPLRVAEDAAVLDILSGGRLELGFGTGGSPGSFAAFDLDPGKKGVVFARHLGRFLEAIDGQPIAGGARLYPAAPDLRRRIWQATFSVEGAERAGRSGDGLMLSRTQPRPPGRALTLSDLQNPMIEAYLGALPPGASPRILASRSIFVADDRREAFRLAEIGIDRFLHRLRAVGRPTPSGSLAEVIATLDMHVGTPDDVMRSLRAETALTHATEVAAQVHPADPPPALTLRSMELFATVVAPALGWTTSSRPATLTAVRQAG
ncbi:putative FMN-dependent luciferase-like monooxygenase [uncultured Enterovirga sp.]|uniref:putative FMN-dependent luciferase-like monooxygenase n=1 Tax=uncultured Enterovirga sp. TaxID=2026352 RepID=UPI0035CB259D